MATVDSTTSAANAASTAKTSTASATKSDQSRTSLTSNFNTFLNMLTTQLKHQDPLSPMDSTEFTNQLVQFSGVEQQINTNSNLEKLITLQQGGLTAQAIGYLGQTVEVPGNSLALQGGSASFTYTLPENASSCEVQIKDSSGTVVYKTNVDTGAGRHTLAWDGTNTAGKAQDDGLYTVKVVAKGKDGSALDSTVTTYGQVTNIGNDTTKGTVLEIVAGKNDKKLTVTPTEILGIAANTTLYNNQMLAAKAQYQAAIAQYQALQAGKGTASTGASSGTDTTSSTTAAAQ